jgi:eukaryotic-like serine/threonine-protein kinase
LIQSGQQIDGKYEMAGVCSTLGGMGTLLFVKPLHRFYSFPLVLKYCHDTGEEVLHRFRREVRLLVEFQGNSKVVEIVDHNIDHDPPYFVMRYYTSGDLQNASDRLRADLAFQEKLFGQMVDSLAELHSRGKFHRDVKPQNFLLHDDGVVVSDFGLSKELERHTAATRSSQYWGTMGYLPPEFLVPGGFKNASAPSDIFMLGKTFYVLLTGRDPTYLTGDGIAPAIYTVIERCCDVRPENRYKDLATLKQRLTAAYDVLLGRHIGSGRAGQRLAQINDRLKLNQADSGEVVEFFESLAMLGDAERTQILFELQANTFRAFALPGVQSHMPQFLRVYQEMVESATYGWSYAEVIADNMKVLFDQPSVSQADRTHALELAITAAVRQNRFAAMDTCKSMIRSIRDEHLGYRVAEMLVQHQEHFILSIEPSECHSDAVIAAIQRMKESTGQSQQANGLDWLRSS